jgi:hypothetical protein
MRPHHSPAISTVNICFTTLVHTVRDACWRAMAALYKRYG